MGMLKKLGPLDGLLGMLPGMNKLKKQIPAGMLDDKRMKRMEAIVLSMTPRERSQPQLIKGTRKRRIANGSGNSLIEVNNLLKNFANMRKMMKSKGKMKQMMEQLGGMEGMPDMGGMLGGGKKGKGGEPSLDDLAAMEDMMKKAKGGKGGKGGFPF